MQVDIPEILIEAIKMKPEIYNKSLALHHDRDTMDKDWEIVHEFVIKFCHVQITGNFIK